MRSKPVVPTELALQDIDEAIAHYLAEGGASLALRFIDSLEAAYEGLAQHPAAGSPRFGQELGVPGLRHRLLHPFPYLVFYMELDERTEIWRVLHGARDLPKWLSPDT